MLFRSPAGGGGGGAGRPRRDQNVEKPRTDDAGTSAAEQAVPADQAPVADAPDTTTPTPGAGETEAPQTEARNASQEKPKRSPRKTKDS